MRLADDQRAYQDAPPFDIVPTIQGKAQADAESAPQSTSTSSQGLFQGILVSTAPEGLQQQAALEEPDLAAVKRLRAQFMLPFAMAPAEDQNAGMHEQEPICTIPTAS